jgi:DNA-binding NarL/FixJ family response regulator
VDAEEAVVTAGVGARCAPRPLRVLVVDDSDALRHLLRARHGLEAAFEVVGEAGDGLAGMVAARQLDPDVVILDLAMPRMGGREALVGIVGAVPGVRVVIFTGSGPDDPQELRGLGAAAIVDKGGGVDVLVAAMLALPAPDAPA